MKWRNIAAIGIAVTIVATFVHDSGLLSPNTVVVEAMACTCPDYKVHLGSWKLDDATFDTIPYLDRSEIYVRGIVNPWSDSYLSRYDPVAVTGRVVGIDRVSEGDPWNPVIEAESWRRIRGFEVRKWCSLLTLAALVVLPILRRKRTS